MSPAALNKLTRDVTAFGSWRELVTCTDTGYLPSLSSQRPLQAYLALCLVERSIAVFDPSTGKNWPMELAVQ